MRACLLVCGYVCLIDPLRNFPFFLRTGIICCCCFCSGGGGSASRY